MGEGMRDGSGSRYSFKQRFILILEVGSMITNEIQRGKLYPY